MLQHEPLRVILFMPTEKELQHNTASYFSKWFDVEREIKSDCLKRRIDILMFHKSDKENILPIGIEIKIVDTKKGSELADWCLQAQHYSTLSFRQFKPTIFILPQITGNYLDEGLLINKHNIESPGIKGVHNNVNSFLYKAFNFGEVQKYKFNNIYYSRLVINTKQIWDSRIPQNIIL